MTAPAVTVTFVANTVLTASNLNTNFSDLVTYVSNRNDGSATWDRLLVTSASAVPLVVNNSTGTTNIANFQDNGTNVFQIVDGGDVYMNTTKKLYLDGGSNTYITEGAADRIQMITGGTTRFTLDNGGFLNLPTLDVYITATNKVYLDGGTDTYIFEEASNRISFVTGGSVRLRLDHTGFLNVVATDLYMTATNKLYLDGGNDTFIYEASGNQIDFTTGGTLALSITSGQILDYRLAAVALGAGGAATLGLTGGSGPATTTQNSWVKVKIAGTDSYIPIWR